MTTAPMPRLSKTVFLFPGQGTQYLGMGRELYERSSETRAVWECASDVSGFNVRQLCLKGPMTTLTDTRYQQIAVTTVNIASLRVVQSVMDGCALAAAGHSVGEYAALHAAGALSLEDTFRLVSVRARLMWEQAQALPGAMYAVAGSDAAIIRAQIAHMDLQGKVCVANDNTPKQQVISGARDQVRRLASALAEQGFKQTRLPVDGAWHSPMMQGRDKEFRKALDSAAFKRPALPVYMNTIATFPNDLESIRSNLVAHLYSPVRWRDTIEAFCRLEPEAFMEIGPRKILSKMLADFPARPPGSAMLHVSDLMSGERKELASTAFQTRN